MHYSIHFIYNNIIQCISIRITDFAFYKPFYFWEEDLGRFNNFFNSQKAPPEKFV